MDDSQSPSNPVPGQRAPASSSAEIGAARRSEDAFRLLQGRGQYVADLPASGALYLAFVRSAYAHARIRQVDTRVAARAPGVAAVLTAADVPPAPAGRAQPGTEVRSVPPPLLAGEVVHAVGVPIVAVIAETDAQAADAASLVSIDYEPLPVVTDPEAALAPGAPLVHPEIGTNVAFTLTRGQGDVEAAFAMAEKIVSVRLAIPRLAGAPLEPLGALASWDNQTGQLTVWCTTQAPWRVHGVLTGVLGLSPDAVRVLSPDVGGGFGVRGPVYGEYVVAALAAHRLRRTVRWSATRREDFLVTQASRETLAEAELASTRDGQFLALRARVVTNVGAYTSSYGPAHRIVSLLTGAYRIPVASVEVSGVYTNTGITGAYRGAGRPEAAFVVERLVEEMAAALGQDSIELRRRNFIPPESFPYVTPLGTTFDSGRYAVALDQALALLDCDRLRREQQARLSAGTREILGIGLMSYIEPTGGGWESGRVRVEPDGRVVAVSGSVNHGQGHRTTFAQIVADRLHVPFDAVEVRQGDTADGLPGIGTFGSRSTALGGGALTVVADEVFERGRQIAAHLLEAAPDDVVCRDGRFSIVGVSTGERSVSWRDVAEAAASGKLPPTIPSSLEAQTQFDMHGEAFAFGTCGAVVAVDRETGSVRLERLVLVHDCGTVVNPRLMVAQLHGGLAQGAGEALGEWVRYDTAGQLLTGSLLDYWLPRADDLPLFELGETVTPSPLNAIGAKGVGEAGTIAAPAAISHAVLDALRPLGVRSLDMPFTPERVWSALRAARGASGTPT